MEDTIQSFAREAEQRLRPLHAALVAASHGGRDTRGQELHALAETIRGVPDRLRDIQEWAECYAVPAKETRRPRGRR